MPVIKSAKKKLRQDKKRQIRNKRIKNLLADTVKKAKKNATRANILNAFRAADKAAKLKIIHKNKASRVKSALSKLLNKKTENKTEKKKTPKAKK